MSKRAEYLFAKPCFQFSGNWQVILLKNPKKVHLSKNEKEKPLKRSMLHAKIAKKDELDVAMEMADGGEIMKAQRERMMLTINGEVCATNQEGSEFGFNKKVPISTLYQKN